MAEKGGWLAGWLAGLGWDLGKKKLAGLTTTSGYSVHLHLLRKVVVAWYEVMGHGQVAGPNLEGVT